MDLQRQATTGRGNTLHSRSKGERALKEEKQKKLETARTKKTKDRAPRSDTETYADVPKKHLREKLNPKKGDEKTRERERRIKRTAA